MKSPIALLLLLAGLTPALAGTIALDNPAVVANQNFAGSVGMDFETGIEPLNITHLGVFDSGQDGYTTARTVSIYDRTNTTTPYATLTIPAGTGATLINGNRFMPLASSVTLPAGFRGSIVVNDVSVDGIWNKGLAPNALATINNGGGLLQFVGSSRFGALTGYPATLDQGPANRYMADTFQFETTSVTPKYVAYGVASGLTGAQNFGGPVGMDFDVGASAVLMTHIGVFDSGGNGINGTLTAYIYDRDTQGIIAGPFSFTGSADPLVGGSRFRDIADVTLPAGFHGSVVVEGYGASELLYNNANGGAGASNPGTGNGLISFTGAGRYGLNGAGTYPGVVDAGPGNRYAAGTFAFMVPEPASASALILAGGLLGARRRRPGR